jgi:uncharacterized protein (TIGR02996 family)
VPRLESASKFWSGELRNGGIDMRWGERGTYGRSAWIPGDQTKLEALIEARRAEGFAVVAGDRNASAPIVRWSRRYASSSAFVEITLDGRNLHVRRGSDEPVEHELHINRFSAQEIAERLAEVERSRGLVLVGETLPIFDAGPLPAATNPQLVAQCLATPDDPAVWAVYADWLIAHGDVRGELAALISRNEGAERMVALRPGLFGGHRDLVDCLEITAYRFGFPSEIVFTVPRGDALQATLAAVLELPMFELLDRVNAHYLPIDYATIVAAIAASPLARSLRRLELGTGFSSAAPLGPIAELTGLRELHCSTFPDDHPTLRTLIASLDSVHDATSFAGGRLPSLERLELVSTSIVGLDVILDHARVPELRHLRIASPPSEHLIELLARSTALPYLRTLDLGKLPLPPSASRRLADDAARFRHLERIIVGPHRGGRLARALPNLRTA